MDSSNMEIILTNRNICIVAGASRARCAGAGDQTGTCSNVSQQTFP